MKISYDVSKLIEELKADIKEFGNIDMYAWFEKVDNYILLTNYDFIDEELPLKDGELDNSVVIKMKAEDILKLLEKENEIL